MKHTLLILSTIVWMACSGNSNQGESNDGGHQPDAAHPDADAAPDGPLSDGAEDAVACVPGDEQGCELGRPCPGAAICLQDGSGFGVCGCVSCDVELTAGACSWPLGTFGLGSANPAFLSVLLKDGNTREDVFPVSSSSGCGEAGGWYMTGVDTLELCPASCDQVNGGAVPIVRLGCGRE